MQKIVVENVQLGMFFKENNTCKDKKQLEVFFQYCILENYYAIKVIIRRGVVDRRSKGKLRD